MSASSGCWWFAVTCLGIYTLTICGQALKRLKTVAMSWRSALLLVVLRIHLNYVVFVLGSVPASGYLFSFAQDNNKDVYLLSSSGVYWIVPPSRCGYTCDLESTTTGPNPTPPSPRGSSANMLKGSTKIILVLVLFFLGLGY